MTTITLLEQARLGRRNALASLGSHKKHANNVVSIFDYAFDDIDDSPAQPQPAPSNVIAFRSARAALPAPNPTERLAA